MVWRAPPLSAKEIIVQMAPRCGANGFRTTPRSLARAVLMQTPPLSTALSFQGDPRKLLTASLSGVNGANCFSARQRVHTNAAAFQRNVFLEGLQKGRSGVSYTQQRSLHIILACFPTTAGSA